MKHCTPLYTLLIITTSLNAMEFPHALMRAEHKKLSNPVWLRTSDNQILSLAKWKVDLMKVLQVQYVHQPADKNSEHNPVDVSIVEYYDHKVTADKIKALSIVLEAIINPAKSFQHKWDKLTLVQKHDLINTAAAVEANSLSALFASYHLPQLAQTEVISNIINAMYLPPSKQMLSGHHNEEDILCVALSSDSTKIVFGSEGSQENLIVLDSKTGQHLYILDGHPNFVQCVAFNSDSTKIASGSRGKNNLIIWDSITGKQLHSFEKHPGLVNCIAWSPNGTRIVSGCSGGYDNLIVWDTATGRSQYIIDDYQMSIMCVAWSPDGTKITSGCMFGDRLLIVWGAATGELLHILDGHPWGINCVAWSPDSTNIVSGSMHHQNNLIVWDAITGKLLHILDGHPSSVTCVAFNADGTRIVSGCRSRESNLIIWDTKTGKRLRILDGHPNTVNYVAFNADGTKLISGSDIDVGHKNPDNLIVWNTATWQPHVLVGHSRSVMYVASSLDGTTIVSGCRGSKNNLILWLFPDKEMKKIARYCTVDQARFIYRLHNAKLNNVPVKLHVQYSPDYVLYQNIPDVVEEFIRCNFTFHIIV